MNDTTAILIPAYKAAKELESLLPQIREYCSTDHIYVVNDGSCDTTEKVCAENNITCISHKKNRGKGAALKTGFTFLSVHKYQWVITMDADGQHRPRELPGFFKACSAASDTTALILGKRDIRPEKMPLLRILSNTMTSALLSIITKKRIEDSQCGYRAYNLQIVQKLSSRFNHFEYETEILLRILMRRHPVISLPVETVYIPQGPSHISHITDTLRWIAAVSITVLTHPREKQ
ncbi:MAG: glycosyltransferase family 2 protein [Fibrobacterota bacterium]